MSDLKRYMLAASFATMALGAVAATMDVFFVGSVGAFLIPFLPVRRQATSVR